MSHQLSKVAIEALSKQLYGLITSRMTKEERESAGVDYNGTLDSILP